MKSTYRKGLILSLGLHTIALSFFYFNNNNFKKSESSMTEVIIVSSDENTRSDKKSEYKRNVKKTSVDQKKINNVKKKFNKSTTTSELKSNENNSQLKATVEPNAFEKENYSENNRSKKDIFNKLKENEEVTKNTGGNFSVKSASRKIFQSSASYKIGSENNPHPNYPLLARKKGWEGKVIIQAIVDKKGNVKFIKVLESSGYEVLDDVSLKTLKIWKFRPAILGGKSVDDTVNIPVRFVLTN